MTPATVLSVPIAFAISVALHSPVERGLTWMSETITGEIAGTATVLDGDTIEIHGTRIRLYGIDAPENGQTCTNSYGAKYSCGKLSTFVLATMLQGKEVSCTPHDFDQYGRTVATCFSDGLDLGDLMVRSGWAINYQRYSRGRYLEAEEDARTERRGMWAGTFDRPEAWRRENRH